MENNTYYNITTNEEEVIPTLVNRDDEYVKVDNLVDLKQLIRCMGWESLEEFAEETETAVECLIGKFWFTIDGAVYVE